MDVDKIGLVNNGLVLEASGPPAKPGSASTGALIAGFEFNTDLSPLFPYLNAVAQSPRLFQNPAFIRFTFEEHLCGLHPHSGVASPFTSHGEAELFVEHLLDFLNGVRQRQNEIVPKYKVFRQMSVVDIIRLLPRTNCRECGFPTCLAFAASVSLQETRPECCPHLGAPLTEQKVYPVFDNQGRVSSTVTIEVEEVGDHPQTVPETGNLAGPSETNAPIQALTPRETQVLSLLAQGATNREISKRLQISPHTVKTHVIHIFDKLGVNDRTLAAVWAARLGLI